MYQRPQFHADLFPLNPFVSDGVSLAKQMFPKGSDHIHAAYLQQDKRFDCADDKGQTALVDEKGLSLCAVPVAFRQIRWYDGDIEKQGFST